VAWPNGLICASTRFIGSKSVVDTFPKGSWTAIGWPLALHVVHSPVGFYTPLHQPLVS
jgi:hypothetical protein